MKNQAYNNGFIKRAMEYGCTQAQATNLLKQAHGNYLTMGGMGGVGMPQPSMQAPAPIAPPAPMGAPGAAGPLGSMAKPSAAPAPAPQPYNPIKPGPVNWGGTAPGGPGAPSQTVQPKLAPTSSDLIAQWSKYHGRGAQFNPNSRMDRAKLLNMQKAQSSGGSIVQGANKAWR